MFLNDLNDQFVKFRNTLPIKMDNTGAAMAA
jgi:hypothetical protein